MSRRMGFVAVLGLLCGACGPADVDYTQTAREQCAAGAYRDAGADGAVVAAVLDDRARCRVTCADGWGTCSTGPACARVIHTDTDCNACGDRCVPGDSHCARVPLIGTTDTTWSCVAVTR